VLLLYPLIQGNDLGWPPWAFAMMAAALPVLGLFAWYEGRRERLGRLPLVPASLFRERSFSAGPPRGRCGTRSPRSRSPSW
jgi:hypothetical protein